MLSFAAAHLISTFQAIVLGVVQGATELFPVSSLGHTVLLPTLFRWGNIVAWQSQPESPWLAFVVMLHVGSAVGLLIYFWRDWIALIKAFFATVGKRRIETPTERLAWLIVVATIPVGILGLLLERVIREALAKPLSAAIFLMVNGCILLYAERYRKRAEVRELARREGLNPEGYRALDTMDVPRGGHHRHRSDVRADRRHQPRRRGHDRGVGPRHWTTPTPPASASCSPHRRSSPPASSSSAT